MRTRAGLKMVICLCVAFAFAFTGPKPKPKGPQDTKVEISTIYGKIVVRLYNKTPKHRDNFIKLVKAGFYDSLLFHRSIKDFMIQGGDPNSKYAKPDEMLGQGDLGYTIPAEIVPEYYHKRGALAAARDDNPDKASHASQFYIVKGKKFTAPELTQIMNTYNYNTKMSILSAIMNSDSVKAKMNDYAYRGDNDGLTAYTKSIQNDVDKAFAPHALTYLPQQAQHYLSIGGVPHLDRGYTVFGEVISGMNVIDSIISQPTNKSDRPLTDIRMKMRLIP